MRSHWLKNPIGELLYLGISKALSLRPIYESDPPTPPAEQPEVLGVVEKPCPKCRKITEQEDFWWVEDQEFTRECRACGGVWSIA